MLTNFILFRNNYTVDQDKLNGVVDAISKDDRCDDGAYHTSYFIEDIYERPEVVFVDDMMNWCKDALTEMFSLVGKDIEIELGLTSLTGVKSTMVLMVSMTTSTPPLYSVGSILLDQLNRNASTSSRTVRSITQNKSQATSSYSIHLPYMVLMSAMKMRLE